MRPPSAFVIAVAALSLAVPGSLADTSRSAPPATRDKLQDLLSSLVTQADAPGGVLVVRKGSAIWRGAVGLAQIEPRRRMTASGRFRVASVTKVFTAALVLQLVTEGKLSLEDTVERWLPGRIPDGAGNNITLRHLLQQTSGLTDEPTGWVTEARGTFSYANRNYDLLGQIVAAVTGEPYEQQLSTRVLVPLRLTRTEPSMPSATPAGLVHGYTPSRPRIDVTRVSQPGPAAGLVSTAADLMRFERALNAGRVIPRTLVDAMRVAVPAGRYSARGYNGYGLGLMRFPAGCGPAWGHRGLHNGYVSWLLWARDGRRAVVALVNVGYLTGDAPMLSRLSGIVTRALCT